MPTSSLSTGFRELFASLYSSQDSLGSEQVGRLVDIKPSGLAWESIRPVNTQGLGTDVSWQTRAPSPTIRESSAERVYCTQPLLA